MINIKFLNVKDNDLNFFCPLMLGIDLNLNRHFMWNCLKVHAIYGIFYLMCLSQEGLLHLISYFSAKDQRLLDPIFIAQYLLVPVNTIVDNHLLPWMMKEYDPPAPR